MLDKLIESGYWSDTLIVALVCSVVLIVAVAATLTSIFAPASSPYDTLTECVAKGQVTHRGVTFACEVEK